MKASNCYKFSNNRCRKRQRLFFLSFSYNAKNFNYTKFAHITPKSQNFHLRQYFIPKFDFLSCMDVIWAF